jgi:hypothetical protein
MRQRVWWSVPMFEEDPSEFVVIGSMCLVYAFTLVMLAALW